MNPLNKFSTNELSKEDLEVKDFQYEGNPYSIIKAKISLNGTNAIAAKLKYLLLREIFDLLENQFKQAFVETQRRKLWEFNSTKGGQIDVSLSVSCSIFDPNLADEIEDLPNNLREMQLYLSHVGLDRELSFEYNSKKATVSQLDIWKLIWLVYSYNDLMSAFRNGGNFYLPLNNTEKQIDVLKALFSFVLPGASKFSLHSRKNVSLYTYELIIDKRPIRVYNTYNQGKINLGSTMVELNGSMFNHILYYTIIGWEK